MFSQSGNIPDVNCVPAILECEWEGEGNNLRLSTPARTSCNLHIRPQHAKMEMFVKKVKGHLFTVL